jgi:hypothetical protein
MYDVNDDMENLFRRAAEDYPLKTDGMDWEKVEKGLAASDADPVDIKSKKNDRSWFLLLLLIPVMWICNNYSHKTNPDGTNTIAANYNKGNAGNTSGFINKKIIKAEATKNNIEKGYSQPGNETASQKPTLKNFASVDKSGNAEKNIDGRLPDRKNFALNNQTGSSSQVLKSQPPTLNQSNQLENIVTPATPMPDTPKAIAVKTEEAVTNKTNVGTAQENKNTAAKKNVSISRKKFYVGLVATLDVSTVKFQTTETIGKGLGGLLGYDVRPRLHIEAGASLQQKFYFSDAKYFNPKTSYSSPTYKLINVDGHCNMWEIALNAKYDFKTSAKHNWFLIAGSSSYIMKSEKYDYTYESYGQTVDRYMSYNNSSTNWFSTLNLSAGYERKFRAGAIRLEPYLKVPLKGVGWGRLPITSMGLNIGYTRKLF